MFKLKNQKAKDKNRLFSADDNQEGNPANRGERGKITIEDLS